MSVLSVSSTVSADKKVLALRTRTAVSRVRSLSLSPDKQFSFVGDLLSMMCYVEVSKQLGIEKGYLACLGAIQVCTKVRGYAHSADLHEMLGYRDAYRLKAISDLMIVGMVARLPTKQPLANGKVLVTGYVPTAYGLEVMDMIGDMWKRLVKDINKGILPIDRKKT